MRRCQAELMHAITRVQGHRAVIDQRCQSSRTAHHASAIAPYRCRSSPPPGMDRRPQCAHAGAGRRRRASARRGLRLRARLRLTQPSSEQPSSSQPLLFFAAAFFAAPFFAATFFFFARSGFFRLLRFLVFDFAFFAMIVLPIVSVLIVTTRVGLGADGTRAPPHRVPCSDRRRGRTARRTRPLPPAAPRTSARRSPSRSVRPYARPGWSVPAAICVMQPMLPAAITSGAIFRYSRLCASRNLFAMSGCRML